MFQDRIEFAFLPQQFSTERGEVLVGNHDGDDQEDVNKKDQTRICIHVRLPITVIYGESPAHQRLLVRSNAADNAAAVKIS
jgi:hypothetical protein